MINLLMETINTLRKNGKSLNEIIFVTDGCNCHMATKSYLRKLLDVDYDNGYGTHQINLELKLVGQDFWLERWEYDGSEGWSFKQKPKYVDTNFKTIMVRE